jgi:hypothetical protein
MRGRAVACADMFNFTASGSGARDRAACAPRGAIRTFIEGLLPAEPTLGN